MFWLPDLLRFAFQCPSALLATGTTIAAMALLLAGAARCRPGVLRTSLTAAAVLAVPALLWLLRDTTFLVADSGLWSRSAGSSDASSFSTRSPLGYWLMRLVAGATPEGVAATVSLALLAIAGGLVTSALLVVFLVRRRSCHFGTALRMVVPLLFLQPMSFVFFGHIEVYAVVVPLFVAALLSVHEDLAADRRLGPTSVVLIGLASLAHVFGVVIAGYAVLESLRVPERLPRPRLVLPIVGGALVAVGMAVVPVLRQHGLLAQGWSVMEYLRYVAGVAWALGLVACGFGYVNCVRAASESSRRATRFLHLCALSFATIPLVLVLELGVYRDLDVFSPAFAALVAMAVAAPAGSWVVGRWKLALRVVGGVCLVALLAVNRSDCGARYFRHVLVVEAMTPAARAYGYESLARHEAEAGRFARAVEAQDEAIRLEKGNLRLVARRGELEAAAGDTAAAIRSLSAALGHTDRDLEVRSALAELHVRQASFGPAIAILTDDLPAVLTRQSTASLLAFALARTGDFERMQEVCARRLSIDSGDAVAWRNMAVALRALGRNDEANAAMAEAERRK